MRWLLLVLALTGCRQIFGIEDPHQRLGDDAPSLADDAKLFVDAHPDATPVAPGHCDINDPTLVGCWDFEGDLKDTSSNHLDATGAGVTYQLGTIGKAVEVNDTDVVVAEDTRLDLSSVTIEAWINPKQLPVIGQRMGIVDNQGQYGLFLYNNGIRCIVGTSTVDLVLLVSANTWTHVACTSDGVHAVTWIGTNRSTGLTMPIPTSGTAGLSLGSDSPPGSGSRFVGLIDAVRLYSAVRSDTAICADNQSVC